MGVQNYISDSYQRELKQYIKIILNSGLLLDEDLEAVQTQFNFNFDVETNCGTQLNLTAVFMGGCCLTSALFFLKANHLWMLGICSTFSLAVLSPKIKSYFNERSIRCNLHQLIDNMVCILKLNRNILEYYRHRKSFSSSSDDKSLTAFTKKVEDLLKAVKDNEIKFLDELRACINSYSIFNPSLEDNFSYLNQIDFQTLLDSEVVSIEDCISYHKKISDAFILITSNYLACLALALCPNLWAKNKPFKVPREILKSVPNVHKSSQVCLSKTKHKFDETRYSLVRNKNTKIQVKDLKKYTEPKLHKYLLSSMTHTAIILEKSQIIFDKVQKFNPRVQNLSRELNELRLQAFDYYQSLDILCQLYDVATNARQKTPEKSDKIEDKDVENSESECAPQVLEIAENSNSEDEEFETYIGENDHLLEPSRYNYEDEEESLKFVSLMTQELKHSLKTHSRFVKAREKRGIVEEPLHKKERKNKTQDRPTEITGPQGINVQFATPILPPPPPPLPTSMDENSGCQIVPSPPGAPPQPIHLFGERLVENDESDFLKTIKAASSSRKMVEDVFGDDPDD